MPRRPHTPAELETIETIATERLRYENIFAAQAEVLRTDRPKQDAAMARINQSPLVAKDGQQWEPTEDNVDQYLAQCDDICQQLPQNFDELSVSEIIGVSLSDTSSRMKILYAAHAALMCLINCKIAKQPESVQLAAMKRHYELAFPGRPHPMNDRVSTLGVSKPAAKPRPIATNEFQNPDDLLGKQFILSEETEESQMYEVTGYYRGRDKSIEYDVLFEECDDDPIQISEKGMLGMLENSLYIPV